LVIEISLYYDARSENHQLPDSLNFTKSSAIFFLILYIEIAKLSHYFLRYKFWLQNEPHCKRPSAHRIQ